jgi:hypothetical protein
MSVKPNRDIYVFCIRSFSYFHFTGWRNYECSILCILFGITHLFKQEHTLTSPKYIYIYIFIYIYKVCFWFLTSECNLIYLTYIQEADYIIIIIIIIIIITNIIILIAYLYSVSFSTRYIGFNAWHSLVRLRASSWKSVLRVATVGVLIMLPLIFYLGAALQAGK